MSFRTNAKVNLFLHIMGLRHDGYHEVETVLHGVKLADDISVTTLDGPVVQVDMRLDHGLEGDIPAQEENLVFIAASTLVESGATDRGVRIDLLKRIPIAAGLGGGSGNAAGVLVVLNELWDLNLDQTRLMELAGGIGADVPYCIGGGTALAKARGDKLTRIPGPEEMWVVLGVSNEPLSTRAVYGAWDEWARPTEISSAPMTMALGSSDPVEIASLLHNDLEPIAFKLRPELEEKKESIVRAGALGAALSGSGPTLFGVADGEYNARRIAASVEGDFDKVLVVRSQLDCIERLSHSID